MPRSGTIRKRETKPDFRYNSTTITKFINRMMRNGKKTPAADQFYSAFDIIKEKLDQDPLMVFNTAIENVKPPMEVRSRRIGGAAYQVPTSVRPDRKESLAIRWIIISAQKKSSSEFKSFSEKLAVELIDAFNNTGGAMKKKEDTIRMADANKAFAHFRW